jgi:hypothetical protein
VFSLVDGKTKAAGPGSNREGWMASGRGPIGGDLHPPFLVFHQLGVKRTNSIEVQRQIQNDMRTLSKLP